MSGRLNLTRISTDPNVGTFGVLKWADESAPFGLSLEDPWKDNQRNISCIPEGDYWCDKYASPTHGHTFIVREVPNRSYILFHRGNTHINTQGCILVGERFHFLNGIPSIAQSREGFNEFYEKARHYREFLLSVKWVEGALDE